MNRRAFRFYLFSLLCALVSTLIPSHPSIAENPQPIAADYIDHAVLTSLSHQGIVKPKVISHVDLTKTFGTTTQWTFVVVQDGRTVEPDEFDEERIFLCLVKRNSADCALNLYRDLKSDIQPESPYHLFTGSVVHANQDKSSPLLLIKVCGEVSGDGDCGIATALYKYSKQADAFTCVFLNHTWRNNNQSTRFIETGPLQGDVIVDYPTENPPYTYWIEVHQAGISGQYSRTLRYRGTTHYSDGDPLAVIDSEMPEILHHLGLWQPGDELPVPPHLPRGCTQLFMRHDEEWCK